MIVDATMAPSLWSRVFSNLSWFIGLTLLLVSTSSRAALNYTHTELAGFELAGFELARLELTNINLTESVQDEDYDSDSDFDSDSDSEVPSESKTSIKTPFTGKRPMLLDAHIGMFPWYGFGGVIGARFGYPILHNGFIKSINNAVYIVGGLDLGVTTWYRVAAFTFAIPVQLNWEFYFTDKWSAFAELGLVLRMTPAFRFPGGSRIPSFGGWIAGDVGGRYHLNDRIALVLRVGSPSTVFGATFKF